jgi:hypothetical protein
MIGPPPSPVVNVVDGHVGAEELKPLLAAEVGTGADAQVAAAVLDE